MFVTPRHLKLWTSTFHFLKWYPPYYSWVQKVVYGYEANLLISPMFEGQYISCYSMDFHVMGLIWKLVAWPLICRHLMKLSLKVTENWVDKEEASAAVLFNETPASVNKSGVDASSSFTQFSVTVWLSITKCRKMKVKETSFHLSPITWKSIE